MAGPPRTDHIETAVSGRTRRDLRLMVADGVLYSIMVGTGEAYLAAFALSLGFSEVLAGWLASLPLLTGAVLQLAAPAMVYRLGSLRRWVVLCATVQSLAFLPLAGAAFIGAIPAWLLFLIAAVYWGANLATGPAWNTWATTLVPSRLRARYFSGRSRITQVGVLIGLVTGGLVLQGGSAADRPAHAFATLFLIAFTARIVASRCLAAQSEPVPLPPNYRKVSLRELAGRWRHGHDARLLTYMLSVQIAVQISAPFFTPYMIRQLKFDYATYMLLISTSFVGKMIFLPVIGRTAHRVGPKRILWIGGLGVIPLSALWLVSDSVGYLLVVQLIAGSLWACYEMGTFLLLFETIPANERTSVLTTFNLANAAAVVGGALVGGWLLATVGTSEHGYHLIFLLSMGIRAGTIPLLARVAAPRFRAVPVPVRTIAVRPSAGSIAPPILPGIRNGGQGDAPNGSGSPPEDGSDEDSEGEETWSDNLADASQTRGGAR